MQSSSVEALRTILLQYEKAVRKPVFSSIWWNSLGHVKLIRTTADDREKRQKLEVMKKKEERVSSRIYATFNNDFFFIWIDVESIF